MDIKFVEHPDGKKYVTRINMADECDGILFYSNLLYVSKNFISNNHSPHIIIFIVA